ncbi:MAG: metallophosphoesterase [Burkholderiaceae bacterium]|nr:metallophosphoesterase [Burkholderiaceae bacterium]
MKIQLMSDLHLSVHAMPVPRTDADVVVIAGDLARPQGSIAWAAQVGQPTLFVAGNHEFYGSDLETTVAQLREHAKGTQVRVLECDEWRFGGVRFLGCTLWSDYRLFTDAAQREAGLQQAMTMVRDFSRITVAPGRSELFTPAVSQRLFDQSVAWLDARFAEQHDGPTVVVTHFAPARGSIHPRFAGSPLNACFVSDLEDRIQRWQPELWLHGHVHDSFDYTVGRTRVVANPRGYARGGVVENAHFDPAFVIDLAS